MGLTFLQPAFLLGALAAALPVIIHLIHRRRALVHRFPAVRFLLLADRRTARKFRVRQWLLLALRVLALILLAIVLARPRLTGSNAQAATMLPPQATVIVVDNSLSMQYRDGQEARLQRAKSLTQRLLQGLGPQDSVAILPLLTPGEGPPAFFSREQDALQEQLTAIVPSHATVALAGTFQRALTLLQESGTPRRRLVFLSDLTMHGWEDFHLSRVPVVPEQVALHFIRLGGVQRDANVVVADVSITEKPFIQHTPLEVTALVRNRSTTMVRNLRVDLFLGTTPIGQQLVDLGPEEQVTVPFRIVAPAAGLHWGEVRLDGDNYAEDDRFYYALRTVTPVHVLVVDGDPGTSLFESDIFYLLNALQPRGVLGRALFHPKPVTWEGLEQERLNAYQVIALCNVEALSPQVRQRLYQFVADGGGLMFFAGNRVEATRYNAMFYRSDTLLLPLALGQPVQRQQEQPMAIGSIDGTHEALSAFDDGAMLQRSKFYRYMTVEGLDTAPHVRVPLTLQDGRPLLVEKSLGRGRVLFFTSSADRDWTDLPTRTAYVPLLHSLVGYAAQLSTAAQRPGVLMPEPARLPGREEDTGSTVAIRAPDGAEQLVRYVREGTLTTAPVSEYTVPGMYRLTTPVGADFLAVNGTRMESNFEKIQLADLQARFRPLPITLEEEDALGRTTASSAVPLQELAGAILLAVVAVLMVENVCANRF